MGKDINRAHGKSPTKLVAKTKRLNHQLPTTVGEDKSVINRRGILSEVTREQKILKIGLQFFTELRNFDVYARQLVLNEITQIDKPTIDDMHRIIAQHGDAKQGGKKN